MLPVSWEQWDRIKDRVTSLGNPRIDMVNYEAAAWGVLVPCVASLLIVGLQKHHETWPLVIYGMVAVGALVVAVLFRIFQKQEKKLRQEDAANIVDEMGTLEKSRRRDARKDDS